VTQGLFRKVGPRGKRRQRGLSRLRRRVKRIWKVKKKIHPIVCLYRGCREGEKRTSAFRLEYALETADWFNQRIDRPSRRKGERGKTTRWLAV